MNVLEIEDLQVGVDGKQILNGVNLTVNEGETHAIMGPNGSGKSTLAYSIAGHPKYDVLHGSIKLNGEEIQDLTPDLRAKAGLFLAQQLPTEIDGINLSNFLRAAVNAVTGTQINVRDWVKLLQAEMSNLKIPVEFANRSVNLGFSGGEKKRTEILQLKLLKPKFAILDETDSGLDVDALKIVGEGVNAAKGEQGFGTILITHHTHLLDYIKPDFVHIFANGKVLESGGAELAENVIKNGYSNWL
ncbi:MAG: Fe-S cluster assembly ATPase SufC [Candidatus Ancillula sp.]|jgi:Fe-S cluster assembly ATP-binding protein|nr:Fe-S cluster assembly ATPase SufC [Candidatus Ancillula sp.]